MSQTRKKRSKMSKSQNASFQHTTESQQKGPSTGFRKVFMKTFTKIKTKWPWRSSAKGSMRSSMNFLRRGTPTKEPFSWTNYRESGGVQNSTVMKDRRMWDKSIKSTSRERETNRFMSNFPMTLPLKWWKLWCLRWEFWAFWPICTGQRELMNRKRKKPRDKLNDWL